MFVFLEKGIIFSFSFFPYYLFYILSSLISYTRHLSLSRPLIMFSLFFSLYLRITCYICSFRNTMPVIDSNGQKQYKMWTLKAADQWAGQCNSTYKKQVKSQHYQIRLESLGCLLTFLTFLSLKLLVCIFIVEGWQTRVQTSFKLLKKKRINLPFSEENEKALPWDSPKHQLSLVSLSWEDLQEPILVWLNKEQGSGLETLAQSLASPVICNTTTAPLKSSFFLFSSQEGVGVFLF